MKLTCRICGQHRVYPQQSDVLVLPRGCETCESTNIEIKPARPLDGADTIARWLLSRLAGRSRIGR